MLTPQKYLDSIDVEIVNRSYVPRSTPLLLSWAACLAGIKTNLIGSRSYMNMINSHALWLAIDAIRLKFPPNIRAHDNYVGEVHSAVDNFNRQSRTTEVLFGVKICEIAVQSEHSICAYLWAGPESRLEISFSDSSCSKTTEKPAVSRLFGFLL